MNKTILIASGLIAALLAGCFGNTAVTVSRVYDGDSFAISNGDQVRLIGIDAPEKGEPGADQAREFLTRLIKGKQIRLESDQEDRDKYKRLLRYAYIGDIFINAEMLKQGLAKTLFIPPNTRYQKEFLEIEKQASQRPSGLWATEPAVYVTNEGKKYHRDGCQHLAKSKNRLTLKEVRDQKYEPCKYCRPAE
jgi:micrococcal nuclease